MGHDFEKCSRICYHIENIDFTNLAGERLYYNLLASVLIASVPLVNRGAWLAVIDSESTFRL